MRTCLFVSMLVGSGPAIAATPDGLSVTDAWFVRTSTHAVNGFFKVKNDSETAVLITGWQSPACSRLTFNESGGISPGNHPAPLNQVTVPPKDALVFVPGGYHLICDGPNSAIEVGRTVPVTMSFRSGKTLTAQFAVRERHKS
ncbi:MAG: copper chaperone PCu(A)C [Janthinobacterium lividum]